MAHDDLPAVVFAELAAAGADTVFGVPGGGPNLEMVGAAEERGMRFVLGHGETSSAISAATYGLLTGQPGVCVVTRGPGAASAVNGAAQATLDRAPLVLLTDTVPAAHAARVPHQRLDQVALLAPVTKWSGTVGAHGAAAVVAGATALARRAPAGAVHLAFDATAPGDAPPAAPDPVAAPAAADVERAVAAVAAARRPLFLLGAEAIPWAAAVREVVAAAGCPALTTYQATGLASDRWDVTGPVFTNGAIERELIGRADLLVAVGLDPVEPIPARWSYEAPVVALHPWAIRDRYFEPAVEVVGAIDVAIRALGGAVESTWEPDAGRRAREHAQRLVQVATRGTAPHDVVAAVAAARPHGTVATVDAGAHMLVVVPLWPADAPYDLLISNGLATMGYAVPAAIATALARPDRPVVCFVGDGGLGMTLAELETIARLGLDITVVVFNDASLSLIEIKQRGGQGGRAAVRYAPTDFAAVARGFGLDATVAHDRQALEGALASPWRGPRVLDVRVDPSGYRDVLRATRG